ncbi:PorV/PorQ family protein [Sphingobacterium pedocola]|uniref:DNA-binding protein n=1 Tax=Sphingobacterium pedocola TaxID=2082722 RepID=A0ABR9T2E1_9SPHI|nr:DNA-binding protein [Sphingobacterium pedocola]MBE8719506.1 DNA-binding protein [Sphingobacterium pedocola]
MYIRIVLLLFASIKLQAQQFNAAPNLGMGNTGLARQSIYSIGLNPAGIAALTNVSVALAYQQHFLSSEIQSQAAYLNIPLKPLGGVGLGVNSYGIHGVSTLLTVRSIYARQFGNQIFSAIGLNYHQFYVKNYGNDQTFSVDLGIQVKMSPHLLIGALIRNISSAHYKEDVEQRIPREIGLGLNYEVSEHLSLVSDVYYDFLSEMNYRAGIEFAFDHRFKLRGGAMSNPLHYFAGIGLILNKIQIDIASSFHPKLGTSPQIAMAYDL